MSHPSSHLEQRRERPRVLDRLRDRCHAFLTLGTFSAAEDPSSKPDPVMLANVERALTKGTFAASFGSQLEKQFIAASANAQRRLVIRVLIFGTLFYDAFLPVDALVVPDVLWLALWLHIGIGTPIACVALAVVKRITHVTANAVLVVAATMLTTTLVIYLSSRAPHAELIGCTFALLIMANNTGLVVAFSRAATATGTALLLVAVATLLHPTLDTAAKVFDILLTSGAAMYSLLGAYRIEASLRRAYLLSLRESLRARSLALDNTELRDLVDLDGLTRIGNRRRFDATLQAAWFKDDGRSLALILLDIDAFKKLNDRFGHQAGDECLRMVSKELDLVSRSEGGVATRYGGEEFAVLLEGANVDDAVRFAERLRIAVEGLRPLIGPGASPVPVTISLGCAAAVPGTYATPTSLVAAADAALYMAKQTGRNRTQAASPTDIPASTLSGNSWSSPAAPLLTPTALLAKA